MEIVLELRRFFYVSVYMGYIYCMGSGGQHCFAYIILIKYGFYFGSRYIFICFGIVKQTEALFCADHL